MYIYVSMTIGVYMYVFELYVDVYVNMIVGNVDASEETVWDIVGGRQVRVYCVCIFV